MPSRNPIQRFEDILENIALIEEFTKGMDLAAFSRSNQVLYAVKHALLVISEAATKIGDVGLVVSSADRLESVAKDVAARGQSWVRAGSGHFSRSGTRGPRGEE